MYEMDERFIASGAPQPFGCGLGAFVLLHAQ